MLINCDIGERGAAHAVDDQLMAYIDIANIACGGHAGDEKSVEYYVKLAREHQVKVTAHLSYPDRENFGRKVLSMQKDTLLSSLELQYKRIGDVATIKLHGALYNEVNTNEELAETLAYWMSEQGIKEVLTPQNSAFDQACISYGIAALHEAFLDRRYIHRDGKLLLAPRGSEGAVIADPKDAIEQFKALQQGHIIIGDTSFELKAQTLCVHSDSDHALDILQALQQHV